MVSMIHSTLTCPTNTSMDREMPWNSLGFVSNTGGRLNRVYNIMRGMSYLWEVLESWLEWAFQWCKGFLEVSLEMI
jgi:hypothetical protein